MIASRYTYEGLDGARPTIPLRPLCCAAAQGGNQKGSGVSRASRANDLDLRPSPFAGTGSRTEGVVRIFLPPPADTLRAAPAPSLRKKRD